MTTPDLSQEYVVRLVKAYSPTETHNPLYDIAPDQIAAYLPSEYWEDEGVIIGLSALLEHIPHAYLLLRKLRLKDPVKFPRLLFNIVYPYGPCNPADRYMCRVVRMLGLPAESEQEPLEQAARVVVDLYINEDITGLVSLFESLQRINLEHKIEYWGFDSRVDPERELWFTATKSCITIHSEEREPLVEIYYASASKSVDIKHPKAF